MKLINWSTLLLLVVSVIPTAKAAMGVVSVGGSCTVTCDHGSCTQEGVAGKVSVCYCDNGNPICKLPVDLDWFETKVTEGKTTIKWKTGIETDNAGFSVRRAMSDNNNGYTNIVKLGKLDAHQGDCTEGNLSVSTQNQIIIATGNSATGACYSFEDISVLDEGTYYYLLEDINTNGDSTFHCKNIDAVTIGQGPTIDLPSAIDFCKKVTGSNN